MCGHQHQGALTLRSALHYGSWHTGSLAGCDKVLILCQNQTQNTPPDNVSVSRYLPLTFTQLCLDKQVEWVAFFSLSALLKVQVCISVRPIRLSRLEAYVSYNTAALGNTTGHCYVVEISSNTHFRDTTSHHITQPQL